MLLWWLPRLTFFMIILQVSLPQMRVLIRKHLKRVVLLFELIMLKVPKHPLPLRLPLLLDLFLQVSLELINAHLSEVLLGSL